MFFLGGAQIDGEANINLVQAEGKRFPGSFGSAFMYFAAGRTILFREEHSKRVLVPKVDFISAPGWSPPGVERRGGPQALLTGKALFAWQKDKRRFRLESVHPGNTLEEIVDTTGFEFDREPDCEIHRGAHERRTRPAQGADCAGDCRELPGLRAPCMGD